MVTTAKKVLGRFWRHVVPVDAGTQTEFNLIESLKEHINHLEMVVQELQAEIKALKNEKDTANDGLASLNLRYNQNKKLLASKIEEVTLLLGQVEASR